MKKGHLLLLTLPIHTIAPMEQSENYNTLCGSSWLVHQAYTRQIELLCTIFGPNCIDNLSQDIFYIFVHKLLSDSKQELFLERFELIKKTHYKEIATQTIDKTVPHSYVVQTLSDIHTCFPQGSRTRTKRIFVSRDGNQLRTTNN